MDYRLKASFHSIDFYHLETDLDSYKIYDEACYPCEVAKEIQLREELESRPYREALPKKEKFEKEEVCIDS